MADERPHILLITTDQQRGDCIGVDGNPVLKTPHLDRLATEGVFFRAAYSEAPACVPMRTAWMLGRHPLTCKQNAWTAFEWKTEQTLSGILADAGYYVAGIGKRHFHPPREMYGFHEMQMHESGRQPPEILDDYLKYLERETEWGGYSRGHGVGNNDIYAAPSVIPEPEHVSSWVARESNKIIERHAAERAGQALFLWASFNKPHSPFDPPRPYDTLYRPQDVPAPHLPASGIEAELPVTQRVARHYTWHTQSVQQMRATKAYYYGLCTHIDECVGRILKQLETSGLAGDTLIVFTSDHGEMLGDHHSYFKSTFYEGSTRVPYVFWLPRPVRERLGISRTGAIDAPVGISSLAGSLLDLAGVERGPTITCDSVVPAMSGEKPDGEHEVAAAFRGRTGPPEAWNHSAMLRWGKYKYIYWQFGDWRQLFELESDPGELNNLADSMPALADEAHARLAKRLAEYPDAREHVLDGDALPGQPWAPPDDWCPPIVGPWGRRAR